jgi:hypothetical protein
MKIKVKYQAATHAIELADGDAATVECLQVAVAKATGVPVLGQRLMHKAKRLDGIGAAGALSSLGVKDGDAILLVGTRTGADGSGAVAVLPKPRLDLVVKEVEVPEGTFRCSFADGPQLQNVFVCMTCWRAANVATVGNAGGCGAYQAICGACSMVCHRGHDVVPWGTRRYTQCECPTDAMVPSGSTVPSVPRCRFLVLEADNSIVPPERVPLPTRTPGRGSGTLQPGAIAKPRGLTSLLRGALAP